MLLLLLLVAFIAVAPSWFVLRVCCRSVWDFPVVLADVLTAFLTTTVSLVLRGGKPRFPEWTVALELMQGVAHRLMTKYGEVVVLEANAQKFRHLADVAGAIQGWFVCREYNTTVQRVTLNGLEHLWLRSKTSTPSNPSTERYTVLYCHGGGYTILSPPLYVALCNRIRQAIIDAVKTTGNKQIEVDVFIANYRKSPEAKYPVPQEDTVLAYEYLLDHERVPANRLIIVGDSAGGGLVLSTLMRLRDGEKPRDQPMAAVLLFPLADFAEDTDPKRGQRCMISKSFVFASIRAFLPTLKDPSTWKDASALYCDLQGLAPAIIVVGTQDYLYQDSIKLFEKAQRDGLTTWELNVRPNMPHIFTSLPEAIAPDSTKAIQVMGHFVAKHITGQKT